MFRKLLLMSCGLFFLVWCTIMSLQSSLPMILADLPLSETVTKMLEGRVELQPWTAAGESVGKRIEAIYTYGHPRVIGSCSTNCRRFASSATSASASITLMLLLPWPEAFPWATRRVFSMGPQPTWHSRRFSRRAVGLSRAIAMRGPNFLHYDPSYMLGREIHGSTLGIIGMGRIGEQVARRARGFEMTVLYHNRRRRPDAEASLAVCYAALDELLATADYVLLTVPLTPLTR